MNLRKIMYLNHLSSLGSLILLSSDNSSITIYLAFRNLLIQQVVTLLIKNPPLFFSFFKIIFSLTSFRLSNKFLILVGLTKSSGALLRMMQPISKNCGSCRLIKLHSGSAIWALQRPCKLSSFMQQGAMILHFCCFLKRIASHKGTVISLFALNQRISPESRQSSSSLKLGTIPTWIVSYVKSSSCSIVKSVAMLNQDNRYSNQFNQYLRQLPYKLFTSSQPIPQSKSKCLRLCQNQRIQMMFNNNYFSNFN